MEFFCSISTVTCELCNSNSESHGKVTGPYAVRIVTQLAGEQILGVPVLALKPPRSSPKDTIRWAVAWVLDILHIKTRYWGVAHGFDRKRGLGVDVAVYFADAPPKMYQLSQWLPVFQNHPDNLSFGLVLRSYQTYELLKDTTTLPIVHVPTFADLMALYRVSNFKAVVYVNNAMGNFQSLTVPELAHVHINHGESDKICMVSNQVKAYDRVFVAGEAAVQRHRAALSEFNEQLLVRVGRPQLDENPAASIPLSSRRTIVYAPTWSGEDESNNYTSMETMGSHIIDAALAQENVRVIYKPHPRILDAIDPRVSAHHETILKAMKSAANSHPDAGHEVRLGGDILAIFPHTDLLISDVSSVGLDFLYLRPESPIILTDRRNNIANLNIEAPISMATEVLTSGNIHDAPSIIKGVLSHDKHRSDRGILREFYFDNVKTGESSLRFFAAMNKAISEHSTDMNRARELASRGTGPQLSKTQGNEEVRN
ncbi:unannotated protein [freshwater metagenome]|uniref:Unannotated protein n=1 Tax=freshwater metagenome TaxID=449393 RepID=A0A6J5YW55_9ZZZZ